MQSEKILITGGAGFIGSNFAHFTRTHHPDDRIVILDKLTYAGNKENIDSLIDGESVKFVQGDVADARFIVDFFEKEKFTAVVNFAAETHVDRSIIEPAVFVMTNIIGTHNLLEAALKHGVRRFHQISTDEVYGDLGDGSADFFRETTPLAPNCPYAASKASADILVASYFHTYQLFATISRCSNNYGPYQFPEKLIPYFFQLAQTGKPLPLYGDGKNIRDWLYVEDHCRAIDLILRKAQPGSVYNIGGNNEKQNIEIAQLILKFLGRPTSLITYVADRKAHDRRYAIDASKIKQELGWEPRVSFEDGIKKTFDWYENHREWAQRLVERHAITSSMSHLTARSSLKTRASRATIPSV